MVTEEIMPIACWRDYPAGGVPCAFPSRGTLAAQKAQCESVAYRLREVICWHRYQPTLFVTESWILALDLFCQPTNACSLCILAVQGISFAASKCAAALLEQLLAGYHTLNTLREFYKLGSSHTWLSSTMPLKRRPGWRSFKKVSRCMRSFSASSSRVWIHPLSRRMLRRDRMWRSIPPTIPGTPVLHASDPGQFYSQYHMHALQMHRKHRIHTSWVIFLSHEPI